MLHVAPHSGSNGALSVNVRAAVECDGGLHATALLGLESSAHLQQLDGLTVPWDVPPYDLGFGATDASPDLLSSPTPSPRAGAGTPECAVVLVLDPVERGADGGGGTRVFYGPETALAARRPRRAQLRAAVDGGAARVGGRPRLRRRGVGADAARRRRRVRRRQRGGGAGGRGLHECGHLEIEARAATASGGDCALSVNGLDLFKGCGLDTVVVGRDGVCAAVLDSRAGRASAPRAACFDTRSEGVGAEQLASWIDALPHDATAAIVSCSRFAWAHSVPQLAEALAALGAQSPPTHHDDAYALIGAKGRAAPLAERRLACCERERTPICHTCADAPVVARADTSCGAPIEAATAPSVLESTAVFSDELDSDSRVAAVGAVSTSFAVVLAAAPAPPSDALAALAAAQDADGTVLDAQCGGGGARGGGRLEVRRAPRDRWRRVDVLAERRRGRCRPHGRPGSRRPVSEVRLSWESAAHSVLVMYTSSLDDADGWRVGASVQHAKVPPTTLALSAGGANDASAGVMALPPLHGGRRQSPRVTARGRAARVAEPHHRLGPNVAQRQSSTRASSAPTAGRCADRRATSTSRRAPSAAPVVTGALISRDFRRLSIRPRRRQTLSTAPRSSPAGMSLFRELAEARVRRRGSDGTTVTIDVTCAKHMRKSVLID